MKATGSFTNKIAETAELSKNFGGEEFIKEEDIKSKDLMADKLGDKGLK